MLSPLLSAHYEKSSPCTRMYVSKSLWEKWHGDATPWEKSSSLQDLSVMLFPPLCCNQGSVHCLSHFPTHAWLLCFGVLVRQSNVDVAHRISIEVSSTHVSDGNQKRVFNSKNGFLTRNTEQDWQSFQRRCCREDRFDLFVAHFRTNQNASGNVGLRRYLCWYR